MSVRKTKQQIDGVFKFVCINILAAIIFSFGLFDILLMVAINDMTLVPINVDVAMILFGAGIISSGLMRLKGI